MTLHPDIITDLVILYHAGEASQASRAFLEEEARRNTQVAAALAAAPRAVPALPRASALDEGKTFRKVRLRYQALAFAAVWSIAFLLIVVGFVFPAPTDSVRVQLVATAAPFLFLVLFFGGAVGALYFFVRAVKR